MADTDKLRVYYVVVNVICIIQLLKIVN